MNQIKNQTTLIAITTITILFNTFFGLIIGSSYYFCLKPFIYIGLTIFVYLFSNQKYLVKRDKKYVNQIIIMTSIAYMLLHILSGILFGFANNPLETKENFFFLNLLYYIPSAICIELIRYRLIQLSDQDHLFRDTIIISLIFSLAMSNLSLTMLSSFKSLIETFYQLFVPNFVIGIFLCYTARRGSLFGNICYILLPTLYTLFSPILPNPQWIIPVLIKTALPIIAYMILENISLVKEKHQERVVKKTFTAQLISIPFMIMVILFACGIFRIYPVAIASNSMNPTFSRGDIQIIDKKKEIYKKGDIIQFYGINNTIFVHRVVSVRKENNIVFYTTKGDNNDIVDLMEISQNKVIGKSLFNIKFLGYPTIWLSEKLK